MRAKSIKNRARVNAEMSPAELKVMLAKCRGELAWSETFNQALVGEVTVWRAGGTVDEAEWATEERLRGTIGTSALAAAPAAAPSQKRPPSSLLSPSLTSSTPSRSASPSVPGTGRDTPSLPRLDLDEFLRRENELNDVIAEKVRLGACKLFQTPADNLQESALAEKSRENEELRRQLESLQQQWDGTIQVRSSASSHTRSLIPPAGPHYHRARTQRSQRRSRSARTGIPRGARRTRCRARPGIRNLDRTGRRQAAGRGARAAAGRGGGGRSGEEKGGDAGGDDGQD